MLCLDPSEAVPVLVVDLHAPAQPVGGDLVEGAVGELEASDAVSEVGLRALAGLSELDVHHALGAVKEHGRGVAEINCKKRVMET